MTTLTTTLGGGLRFGVIFIRSRGVAGVDEVREAVGRRLLGVARVEPVACGGVGRREALGAEAAGAPAAPPPCSHFWQSVAASHPPSPDPMKPARNK